MNLSLSEEQQQIVDSAVTFLQEASAMPAVRAALDSARDQRVSAPSGGVLGRSAGAK